MKQRQTPASRVELAASLYLHRRAALFTHRELARIVGQGCVWGDIAQAEDPRCPQLLPPFIVAIVDGALKADGVLIELRKKAT